MRSFLGTAPRARILAAGTLLAAFAAAGCSHSTGSLTPSVTAGTSSRKVAPSAKKVYPITLAAYPATLDAFPATLGAYPAGLDAFPVCAQAVDSSTAKCKSAYRTSLSAIPAVVDPTLLPGYAPVHLQTMYNLLSESANSGAGRKVAIVSAFVDANLEHDLAVYRAEYGLSPCTVANGCLTIKNAGNRGADAGWAAETAIDTEMVSALCPNCSIEVVQAKSAKVADLGAAVDIAAADGPVAISNSYSTTEVGAVSYASHWVHPGMAIVAGGGDNGYGVSFPASMPNVVAVGGVSIQQNSDGTFAAPTVWGGTGSGCSAYFKKPTWQTDTGCPNRTANDITALADPRTGVSGYSTQNGGWGVYGGTSVAAPLVAAMYALAGATAGMTDGSALYDTPDSLRAGFISVTGSNGSCVVTYLCTAMPNAYDGPSGNGMPWTLNPFTPTTSQGTFTLSLVGT